jgi:hypothetical protein
VQTLYAGSPSSDKTLRLVEGALHGLLCEPEPLRSELQKEMVDWVLARCDDAAAPPPTAEAAAGGGGDAR